MNIKKILDNFKSSGFVNIGPVLSSKEILELSKLSKKAFEHARDKSQGRINYRNYIAKDSGVEGLMYLPQHDVIIAQLIDKTLRSKSVASVLKNVLGHSYKIWQINLRRSSPNDRGLYIYIYCALHCQTAQLCVCVFRTVGCILGGATGTHIFLQLVRGGRTTAGVGHAAAGRCCMVCAGIAGRMEVSVGWHSAAIQIWVCAARTCWHWRLYQRPSALHQCPALQ